MIGHKRGSARRVELSSLRMSPVALAERRGDYAERGLPSCVHLRSPSPCGRDEYHAVDVIIVYSMEPFA